MSNTIQQYTDALAQCKDIFLKKTKDYGTAWTVLRSISIVDQIFIKAQRIKTIQEKKVQLVADGIGSEFIGMVNYCIIGLMQLERNDTTPAEIVYEEVEKLYKTAAQQAHNTMLQKNHDYGEAWREMSQESLVDLIIMKLLRVKQILANDGKTIISEGIDANYTDIINYSLFALILITELKHKG
jgi:hypothetical protein